MDNDIIQTAFSYYDKNSEKYEMKFIHVQYVDFKKTDKDTDRNIINMYDKDNKLLFSYKYELIGVFYGISNTWSWGWSLPRFTKNTVYTSRKILEYGLDLDNDNVFLKTELVTSRFKISNPIQLDLHLAIASYLSKIPIIYKLSYKTKDLDTKDKSKITHSTSNKTTTYYLFLFE